MKKYFLIIGILFPIVLNAQRNSQWRGENRDGIYNETGLLKAWHTNGPELLWHFEGLGDGYSSAAIANGRLYITGLDGNNLVLFVFDLSGNLLNRRVVGREWTRSYRGPRGTVNVNDGKLYIFTSLGTLYCLDEATLNEVWSVNVLSDFDGRNIHWGMTESPLIVGDKIFITPGGRRHNMVALNKKTGALIWSSPGDGTPSSYCSPQFIGDQSVPMIVTQSERNVVAFNANTGDVLWTHPQLRQNPSRNIHPNTPIYYNGEIFSITGYRGGSMLLRLSNGGRSVAQVWSNNVDNQMGGAVKVGNYVFASGHANVGWHCIDWRTGEIKYSSRELANGTVIYADGMLYIFTDTGVVALVRPNPERFEIVSRFNVPHGTNEPWAHLVIHNGVLYVRHGNALLAYKIK